MICGREAFGIGEGGRGGGGGWYSPRPHGSRKGKAVYNQRTWMEMVFGRLKGHRKLNSIRVRGIRKVTVHCLLSVIVLQAQALATNVKACVRRVV